MTPLFVTAALSYLLGSIPFGYILVRLFRGEDIRHRGSGNIGATNVARASPTLGVFTLLLDACKGFAAVAITRALYPGSPVLPAVAALFAVVGHVFTVWLKFRGGKGVATGLGSFIALAPKAVLAVTGVFVVLVLAFRYVSLASIVAVGIFPLAVWWLDGRRSTSTMLALMACASALIITKHHQNIERLRAGTENRLKLGSK